MIFSSRCGITCHLSIQRERSTKSQNTNIESSLGNDVTHDSNMELGFTNRPVSIAAEHDDYTSLQRQADGYERLQNPGKSTRETQDASGYMVPQGQSAEYEEVSDPRKSESTSNDSQRQSADYLEVLESRRSELESDDSQSKYDGHVSAMDYSESLPTNYDENILSEGVYDGQVHISDYTNIN